MKANLRAAIREQKKGERLIVRGKRKLETAKQFLARAKDKERDLIRLTTSARSAWLSAKGNEGNVHQHCS